MIEATALINFGTFLEYDDKKLKLFYSVFFNIKK